MSEGVLIYGSGTKRRAKDIQSFAETILHRNKNNGSYFIIDKIDGRVIRDLKEKGIEVKAKQAIITDATVRKYKQNSKRDKGAAIGFRRFVMVEHAVKHPKNVYIDKHRKRLIYVADTGYRGNKVVKVVVEPNQKFKKKYFFNVVSIGIVNKTKMNDPIYEKIK